MPFWKHGFFIKVNWQTDVHETCYLRACLHRVCVVCLNLWNSWMSGTENNPPNQTMLSGIATNAFLTVTGSKCCSYWFYRLTMKLGKTNVVEWEMFEGQLLVFFLSNLFLLRLTINGTFSRRQNKAINIQIILCTAKQFKKKTHNILQQCH